MKISDLTIVSIRPSTVWYVVTNLSWKPYGKKVQAIRDVRLYEVSPSNPGKNVSAVGMLVGAKSEADAEATVKDILTSYGVLKR